MRILDATAGTRSIWYQKNNPLAVYMDQRQGTFHKCDIVSGSKHKHERNIKIYPDILALWSNLPFKEESFDLIVFDPPHMIKPRDKKLNHMVVYYGHLYQDNWKIVLSNGINSLFKVLKPKGLFILKWCETDKPLDEIINLFPYPPMFGSRTGQKNNNHWVCFMKHQFNQTLDKFE